MSGRDARASARGARWSDKYTLDNYTLKPSEPPIRAATTNTMTAASSTKTPSAPFVSLPVAIAVAADALGSSGSVGGAAASLAASSSAALAASALAASCSALVLATFSASRLAASSSSALAFAAASALAFSAASALARALASTSA